jgi:homoserine dehydrogenase
VSGKGAGRWPTSESVFADLMEIFHYRIGTRN